MFPLLGTSELYLIFLENAWAVNGYNNNSSSFVMVPYLENFAPGAAL